MSFWSEFASADNRKVHTPQLILFFIGVAVMLISIALLIYHCFYHGKGLDGDSVRLILGLLGGGVLNAGASYFSRTTYSSLTSFSNPPEMPPTKEPKPE